MRATLAGVIILLAACEAPPPLEPREPDRLSVLYDEVGRLTATMDSGAIALHQLCHALARSRGYDETAACDDSPMRLFTNSFEEVRLDQDKESQTPWRRK